MVATSSIGPGALNMVTAAGVAHADRLPCCSCPGRHACGRPDPVLQQVEHFGDPTTTVNDAFRPVTRYWDRITRPEQLLQSLPQAVATMLDPADCGPAFLGLPRTSRPRRTTSRRRSSSRGCTGSGAPGRIPRGGGRRRVLRRGAPLVIAGGGVHYLGAESRRSRRARDPGRRDRGRQVVAPLTTRCSPGRSA